MPQHNIQFERSRRARVRYRARGVTLIEILVVVAIMALISSGVAVAVYKHWQDAKISTTFTSARQIRSAVKAWWMERGNDSCPRFDDLIKQGALDRDNTHADSWGSEWSIECEAGDVTVTSAGPDRALGTADDIRVPPVS